MYAASVFFLLVAIGALVAGFFQSGLTFVYASIGASVLAGVFLLIGVLRKRSIVVATAGAPYEPPPWIGPPRAEPAPRVEPLTTPPVARPTVRQPPAPAPEPARPAPGRRPAPKAVRPARKPLSRPRPTTARKKASAARKPAAKKAAATKTAAKKTAARKSAGARAARGGAIAPSGRVVVTERGTFHRPSCRMVKGKSDLESSTRKSAEDDGYSPCGVCKPAGPSSGS